MQNIIKLSKNDIKTTLLGNNIAVAVSQDFMIIFDGDAAIEFANDVLHLAGGFLACTECYKILPVSEMYSVDACSEECQKKINATQQCTE